MRHDDVVRLVEQSTLGALMLQPDALTAIRAWLRPDDFADLWHAQVYTALLERQPVGGMDPNSMAAVMVDRLGTRAANLPRFADLLHVTPPHPDPIAYARLVLDGGLRREAAGLGVLLQAAALTAANDRIAAPLTTACSIIDASLDVIGSRWAQATGRPHDDVVVPLHLRAAARNTGLEARTAADRYLNAHPARDPATEHDHLVRLVGMLIACPQLVPAVADWFPSARVTHAGWRVIYEATVELAELGQHVDVTTVAWAAHAHAHHGPELPALHLLQRAVDDAWHTHPPEVIRDVAADQCRHIADIGTHHLHTMAANPAVLVGDLVDAGHTITTALRGAAAVLPAHPAADRPNVVTPVTGLHEVAAR